MAHDVNKALHDLLKTHGSMSDDDAVAYIKNLKTTSRFMEDVWS